MESCCTALNQIQPQLQNSFRIDSILTGMGPPPPQGYSPMHQHSGSPGGSGGVEALKQFGSMFGKNEELNMQERKRGKTLLLLLFIIIIIIIINNERKLNKILYLLLLLSLLLLLLLLFYY